MLSALDRLCDSLLICKCNIDNNQCPDFTTSPCCAPRRTKYGNREEKEQEDNRVFIADRLMGKRNFTLRAYPFVANIQEPGNGQKSKKGIMMNFLIDTGASDNYMDYKSYKLMKLGDMEPPLDRQIVVANGQRLPIVGHKLMHILLPDGRLSLETRFKIIRGLRDKAVLGDDFLRLHNAVLKYRDRSIGLSDLKQTNLQRVGSLKYTAQDYPFSDQEEEGEKEEPSNDQKKRSQDSNATAPPSPRSDGEHPVSETAFGRGDTQNSALAEVSEQEQVND